MHRRSIRACRCLVCLSLVACAGQAGSNASSTVRDSMGIRIVESGSPQTSQAAAWRIGDPRVTIGGRWEGKGQQLYRVVGAVRLSDGRIVIANAGTGELLRYEADGEFLGSAGNRGEGPGEFESLGWLGRSAEDSLLTWDLALNRVTVFSGEGAYVRDYPIALPDAMAGAVALGTIDGRRLVLSRGASFNPVNGAGVQRQPLSAWVVSSGGQPETEFGPFPGESVELRGGRQPGTTIRTRIPFGTTSLIAVGQDRLAVTDNGRVDVHVYTADGRLFEVLRRPHSPLPLTPEDLAADLDARLARVPPIEEIRAGIRASYEAVPKPEFLPAVRSMRIDQTGCVWVEAGRHVEDTAAHWSIFSPDGAWLTDITLSAELTPLEAGVDYLLALRTDELGVESVLLMDLARG